MTSVTLLDELPVLDLFFADKHSGIFPFLHIFPYSYINSCVYRYLNVVKYEVILLPHWGLDSMYSLIILEEPKWLSGGSHTSVFNGGLLGIHFGSSGDPDTCIHVSGSPGTQKHV